MSTAAPMRAFRLTLRADADTREELARELHNLAELVARDEMTIGVRGSSSSGSLYELKHNPNQTHELYFKQLREYLAEGKEKKQ